MKNKSEEKEVDFNNIEEVLNHFEPKEKSKTVVKRESMGTNSNSSGRKNINAMPNGNSPDRIGIAAYMPNRFQAPGMMTRA